MKLLRYGPRGQEKPGILTADGTLRDVNDIAARLGKPRGERSRLADFASDVL